MSYKLTFSEWIVMKLFGRVQVGTKFLGHGYEPIYAFKCPDNPKHGIVTSTASGYGEYLHCFYCDREERLKVDV